MKLEEAIKTALEYEGRVYKTYMEALDKATDDAGRRVFKVLAEEEKQHVTYLNERLDEWKRTGKITAAKLGTAIPTKQAIEEGMVRLREKVGKKQGAEYDSELEMLRRALQVEVETSNFYKSMVDSLPAAGRTMFARFLEIEQGHQAIVQAEIDAVSGLGFWFDSREFSLEIG